MIYKPFHQLKLSMLGMGNMRLPTTAEGKAFIDEEKAGALLEYAYEHGVNYFDTAYRYHEGASEGFVGRAMKKYPRESWYLASKMPGHMMNYKDGKLGFQGYLSNFHVEHISEIFEEQLQKCGVDYFDFYLLHNVCETSYDFYTNPELGVVDYLLEQKRLGRIRYLGFSAHGRPETIEKFLNHRNCFDFAQIQLNYLDWTLQNAREKYEVLEKHGLPVVVMEPCRGGGLINLPENAAALLKEVRPQDSTASWAFRFFHGLPNVSVVLSGMSTLEQLRENIELFSKEDPITAEEQRQLDKVADILANRVPCTGCRYCCEDCPQGLEIPKLLTMYNEMKFAGMNILNFTVRGMKPEELPSACIGCGACEQACPQSIEVHKYLREFAEVLD